MSRSFPSARLRIDALVIAAIASIGAVALVAGLSVEAMAAETVSQPLLAR